MKRLIGLSVVLSMVFAATSFAATAGPPPGGWNRLNHDFGSSLDGKLTDNGWAVAVHGFNETLSPTTTTIVGDGLGTTDRFATTINVAPVGGVVGPYTWEIRAKMTEGTRPQINYNPASPGFELRWGVNGAGAVGRPPGFLLGAVNTGIETRYQSPIDDPCDAEDVCFEFADEFPGVDLTDWFTLRIVSGLDENNQDAPGVLTAYLSVDGTDDTGHYFLADGFGGAGNFIQIYADTSPAGIPEFEIDYIRAADGAFIPIPEPATMAMIGLGSFLVLRRRHRA